MNNGSTKKKFNIILYPFLLAILPVVNLLSINIGQVSPKDWGRSFLISLAISVILFLICRLIFKNWHKSGLIVSLFILIIFIYGDFINWLTDLFPDSIASYKLYYKSISSIILFSFGVWIIKRKFAYLQKTSFYLNFLAIALFILPVYRIIIFSISEKPVDIQVKSEEVTPGTFLSLDKLKGGIPDVYYILLDAYGRDDVLKEIYQHDNTEFLNFLRNSGFYIAQKSQTNYLSTKLVLLAVLNLQYLDELADKVGRNSSYISLNKMIKHNKVVSAFKEIGYTIINITSTKQKYLVLGDADLNINLKSAGFTLNKFESVLLENTLLSKLLDFIRKRKKPKYYSRRKRILYALDKLAEMPNILGPKFIFAHINCPRSPYIFGPNGEKRAIRMRLFWKPRKSRVKKFIRGYRDQIIFLNKQIKKLIKQILANSSVPPIIILQGDHGNRMFLRKKVEDTCLKESLTILNSYHLPDGGNEKLYDSISPVNSFRIIFDTYFGTDLGLLEDRTYFSHRFWIYNFLDVTDKVNTCTKPWSD